MVRKTVGKNGSNGTANGIPLNRFRPDPLRKSECRNSYRVPYRVPATGAVGAPPLGGGVLLYRVHPRSEAVAPWHPPIAPKLAPFLRAP